MENIIAVLVLAVLIGGAAAYLVRAKRRRSKMCRLPGRGTCSSRYKKKKKKLTGAVTAKKLSLSQECIVRIVYKA